MINKTHTDKYIEPTKIFGNLFFIGTPAVCTYLIDTGDGLIIIDPGDLEGFPVICDNIRELGFKLSDIKYILVSHAHYDHMDSVAEFIRISDAKLFIGREDLPLLEGTVFHYPINPFKPDFLIDDGDIISLGNTDITCVSTPGHTDGTMSFFFNVSDKKSSYRAGMFGGTGTNTLTRDFLSEHNLPFENRQKFMNSVKRLQKEKVDIFLGSHLENNNTEEKLSILRSSDENPFLLNGQAEWNTFLDGRLKRIMQIINENE